ncbi:hypothetical protein BV898_06760 [Hypsibius exemplaris]|uniref:Uncharacterized protein n=1 Tax=Hypsibius exemplaris TaxID=2072580 RepID=A0A1W0WV92_HYPEX|nr:hypothetical protein BV898_06760 [Hypsibius exemplaris]
MHLPQFEKLAKGEKPAKPQKEVTGSAPLSRTASADYEECAATLHEPGDIHVTVTVLTQSEADGDNISCIETVPTEIIDKLLQTVSLPMLWNLSDDSTSTASSTGMKDLPVGTKDLPVGTKDLPAGSARTSTGTPSPPGSSTPSTSSLRQHSFDEDQVETYHHAPVETSTSLDLIDSGGGVPSAGCMESSKRQIHSFYSTCRDFFRF